MDTITTHALPLVLRSVIACMACPDFIDLNDLNGLNSAPPERFFLQRIFHIAIAVQQFYSPKFV